MGRLSLIGLSGSTFNRCWVFSFIISRTSLCTLRNSFVQSLFVQGVVNSYSNPLAMITQQSSEFSSGSSMTPEQWLSGLIEVTWDQWYALWEERNNDLHGSDARKKHSNLRQGVQ